MGLWAKVSKDYLMWLFVRAISFGHLDISITKHFFSVSTPISVTHFFKCSVKKKDHVF